MSKHKNGTAPGAGGEGHYEHHGNETDHRPMHHGNFTAGEHGHGNFTAGEHHPPPGGHFNHTAEGLHHPPPHRPPPSTEDEDTTTASPQKRDYTGNTEIEDPDNADYDQDEDDDSTASVVIAPPPHKAPKKPHSKHNGTHTEMGKHNGTHPEVKHNGTHPHNGTHIEAHHNNGTHHGNGTHVAGSGGEHKKKPKTGSGDKKYVPSRMSDERMRGDVDVDV